MADKSPFFFSELVKNKAALWQHSMQYLDAMKSDSTNNVMSRKSNDDALLSSSLSSFFQPFHPLTTKGMKISTVSPKAEAESTTASTTDILLFLLFDDDEEESLWMATEVILRRVIFASIFTAEIFVWMSFARNARATTNHGQHLRNCQNTLS